MESSVLEDSLKQFEQKKQRCLEIIDNTTSLLTQYEAEFANSDQKGFITTRSLAEMRSKIEDASLKILIAGQFKTGKSTCINALLGEDVLPAYSTPCTAVITEVRYADQPKAELVFKPNLTEVPEDLCPKALEHIKKHKPNVPELTIQGDLSDVLEDYLVIPMNGKEQYESVAESPYALCRLFWPLALCKNNVEIIDSPGINEAEERDKTTMDYVPQVDMVIHVLTALQCYSRSDQTFDQDVESFGNPPLLFLVNRFDQLNNDKERDRLRRHVLDNLKLQKKTGEFGRDGVLFVSAQKALEARGNKDTEAFVQSGFEDFENSIAKIISNQRCKIKFGHIKSVGTELIKLATEHVDGLHKLLDNDVQNLEEKFASKQKIFDELEKRKEKINDKIKREINDFSRDIEVSVREFLYNFCDKEVESTVKNTPVPKVRVLHKEEDEKRIVAELNSALRSALQQSFSTWAKSTGVQLIEERLNNIRDSIASDIHLFNEQLVNLRSDFGLTNAVDVNASDEIFGELMASFFGGGALGALAGGAVFLIGRFVAVLTGPVGWVITGIATLASAVFSLLQLNDAHEAIKEKFALEANKCLRGKIAEMSGSIAKEISEEFAKKVSVICDKLNEQIEGSKKTIQDSIAQLKDTKSDIEAKKEHLSAYRTQFLDLAGQVQSVADSL